MSLKIKYENMNSSSDNIVPLGNSEMQSIIKTNSEAVFIEEKKMIPNNSGFVKKSLIDIAIEFENKVIEKKSQDITSNIESSDIIDPLTESKIEDKPSISENSENNQSATEKNISDVAIIEDVNVKENEVNTDDTNSKNTLESYEINTNESSIVENSLQNEKKAELTLENHEGDTKTSLETALPIVEETQEALDSVRNAVSKSINNAAKENQNNLDMNNQNKNNSLEGINQDIDNFKNIFSALSNLTEKVIHKNIENKIIEIASELAGYQIDKMPDKYDKKIKNFLKSINRFEEKMSIETNDKDYEALLKIENFKNINELIKFMPNSDIARGDIILNCDGMHYSEKTIINN